MDERIKEYHERERKKSNIIIFGVNESEDRPRETDLNFCEDLFREVLKMNPGDTKNEEVYRVGKVAEKREDRPRQNESINGSQSDNAGYGPRNRVKVRPLIVRLEKPWMKWQIIKNARHLKNVVEDEYKNVTISPDLTLKQREESKKLRDELNEKKANGERGWFIKQGKLTQNTSQFFQ